MKLISEYRIEDLLRSFFVINMWLPNIASPIKCEYLYTLLEFNWKKTSNNNKIKTYEEFAILFNKIDSVIPNLSMLEDYVPETDWGEMRYFINNNSYYYFSGASLSNAYDFYSSFEIIHVSLNSEYQIINNFSPLKDLEFTLSIQDMIIKKLPQNFNNETDIEPGHLELPSKDFWIRANVFLDEFVEVKEFDKLQIEQFAKALDSNKKMPDLQEFVNCSFNGINCFYFFLKYDQKYYPVMPRHYLSVLYDKWGILLKKHHKKLLKLNNKIDSKISNSLFNYLTNRFPHNELIGPVSTLDSNLKPHEITYLATFYTNKYLFLFHFIPITKYLKNFDNYLKSLVSIINNSKISITKSHIKLGVWIENEIIKLSPKPESNTFIPKIIVVIPYISTELGSFKIPKDLDAEIISIDQFLGIWDELDNPEELENFLEYRNSLIQNTRIGPFTSYMDLFASFRDSHSVLLEGATTPDILMFDLHWGTNYRYESLKKFWLNFPRESFFGHPRTWKFPQDSPPNLIKSKRYRTYVHFETVDKMLFFINSPSTILDYEEFQITELIMHSIRDAFTNYKDLLKNTNLFENLEKTEIFMVSQSAIERNSKLSHLISFIPVQENWSVKSTIINEGEYGLTVILNQFLLINTLFKAKDRSLQIELLLDICNALCEIKKIDYREKLHDLFTTEKSKPIRFRLYEHEMEVSFPEFSPVYIPSQTDIKRANIQMSQIAKQLDITEGEFEGDIAKNNINSMITGCLELLNKEIHKYNFTYAIPILISNIDSLLHDYNSKNTKITESLQQEVDYIREKSMSTQKSDFLHDYKNYVYLIEKFVHLHPQGSNLLTPSTLKNFLGMVDRIMGLYIASDALHYSIIPVKLKIEHSYLPHLIYDSQAILNEKKYAEEQSSLTLGIIGQENDVPKTYENMKEYYKELDKALYYDLGFSFQDIIDVLRILSLWAHFDVKKEVKKYYTATSEEIGSVCKSNINEFDITVLEPILKSLTLTSENVIAIAGTNMIPKDIPVWEFAKRISRYRVTPLVYMDSKYYWGPYSTLRAAKIWSNTNQRFKLPLPLKTPKTKQVLEKAHNILTSSLEIKIYKIVKRFTTNVERNVFLHKIVQLDKDIGDCDILAFIPDKNIILNIESKIIDDAFCAKDLRRIAEKIIGRKNSSSAYVGGYLQRVERRHSFIEKYATRISKIYGWSSEKNIRIQSLFVTRSSLWWTRFPPVRTQVEFVEIKMLNEYLSNLIKE